MKQIKLLRTSQKEFQVEEFWSSYVFSHILIFLLERKLFNDDDKIININNALLVDFHEMLSTSLSILLAASYSEPSANELQKHSTRFEKISFNNKVYKVNYRMSVCGRLAFAIFSMIRFTEDAKLQNLDIQIHCV